MSACLFTLFCSMAIAYGSAHQYFSIRPVNMTAFSGDDALIKCMVGNKAGPVQWSQNGFMLGYDSNIPGRGNRYSMTGNFSLGEYHLKIKNVSNEDSGWFECQVGPAKNNRPIRSKMYFTVKNESEWSRGKAIRDFATLKTTAINTLYENFSVTKEKDKAPALKTTNLPTNVNVICSSEKIGDGSSVDQFSMFCYYGVIAISILLGIFFLCILCYLCGKK